MELRRSALLICFFMGATTGGAATADLGNRYGLPQIYESEISAAEANVLTSHDRGNKTGNEYANAVIIDVRRVSEHVAGHPPGAYSIPFPHIAGSPSEPNDSTDYIGYDLSYNPLICFTDGCDNGTNKDGTLNPQEFVDYVESLFPDKKNTHILTLCRTGYRSVQAANLLTDAGYEHVRNIWEGFVGNPKYAYDDATGAVKVPLQQLDLNHDNQFNDADKDGWSNYQRLPTTTKINPQRIYSPYSYLYYQ